MSLFVSDNKDKGVVDMSVAATYHPRTAGRDGYTGRLAEAEFMPDCGSGCRGEWVAYKRSSWNYPDVDEDEVLREIVRHSQPLGWNPARPNMEGGALHRMVSEKLGEKLGSGASGLRLYTALRSPLDSRGVDGFFEYDGRVVTIDLTTNPDKVENGYWANVIVGSDLEFAADLITARLSERREAPRLQLGGVSMTLRRPPARCAVA